MGLRLYHSGDAVVAAVIIVAADNDICVDESGPCMRYKTYNHQAHVSTAVKSTRSDERIHKLKTLNPNGVSLHQRCAAYSSGVPLTSNGSQPKQIEANQCKSKQIETIRFSGVPLTPAVCRLHQRCAAYISGVPLTSAVCRLHQRCS